MSQVDDYLADFSGLVRERLDQIRAAVVETVPEAVETLSYSIPTFDLNGKHLIHFAGYKTHIGLYPTPHGITAFEAELSVYKSGKGSVRLPLDQPLPLELVKNIVRFRRDEILSLPVRRKRT